MTGVQTCALPISIFMPERFIREDPDSYFKLLEYSVENNKYLINKMVKENPDLVNKLYTLDSKKFLQVCQTGIDNHDDFDFYWLARLAEDNNNIALLSDLLTLKNMSYNDRMRILLCFPVDTEVDKDILLSFISDPRASSSDIDYISNVLIRHLPELAEAIKDRPKLLYKSILNQLKNVTSTEELDDLIEIIWKLSNENIIFQKSLYTKILKNEYIDSNSIPSVLYSTRDTKYISNYIKTVNDLKILFDILSILRRREFPDYEILKKTIYNKVDELIDTIETVQDQIKVINGCLDPKIISKLINTTSVRDGLISDIVENVLNGFYHNDGLLELSETLVTYLPKSEIGRAHV